MTDDLLDAPVSPLSAREKRDLQKAQLRPLANRRPELYEEDEYTSDEYEQMMDMYNGTLASIEEGEIVKSTVLEVRENMVVLDIGFKSEGTIPLEEFKDMPDLKVGDEVEVLLEHLEDQEGSVVLSKKKADFMRVWERIRVAYESDQPVEGTLVKKIKGGVVVDLMGVDAFLPGSQIALRRVPNIDELLGQRYEFKIIKLNKRRRNIVVSRRAVMEETRAEDRTRLMGNLSEGQVLDGVVKNITDYGAFVDLGGIDGLLHVTDLSYKRVGHPSEMINIGDTVKVQIIRINKDTQRISLGMKQLESDPWDGASAKYPVGAKLSGRVTNITEYGAFVELEAGIEGLVEALKRFDPAKGVRFATYAHYWINKMIFEALRTELGITDSMMRLVTAAAKIVLPDGQDLSPKFVASALKVKADVAAEVVSHVVRLRHHRDEFDADTVAKVVERDDAPTWVIDALKKACGKDFDAFWQATFATTPIEELAEAAGISRQAMSKRIAKAREAVRTSPDAERLRTWWASR